MALRHWPVSFRHSRRSGASIACRSLSISGSGRAFGRMMAGTGVCSPLGLGFWRRDGLAQMILGCLVRRRPRWGGKRPQRKARRVVQPQPRPGSWQRSAVRAACPRGRRGALRRPPDNAPSRCGLPAADAAGSGSELRAAGELDHLRGDLLLPKAVPKQSQSVGHPFQVGLGGQHAGDTRFVLGGKCDQSRLA